MASYYNRRASYVASWAPQRIYPRQEPSFDGPASSISNNLEPTRTRNSATTVLTPAAAETSDTPPPASTPAPPPPLYYPGQAHLARTRLEAAGLPPGLAASTNIASSITCVVPWASHPTATGNRAWKRFIRVSLWFSALTKEKEVLWSEWPKDFGGTRIPPVQAGAQRGATNDEEEGVTRSTSRRSGVSADSGIALTPRGTLDLQHHPLEPLFRSRIEELNELIPQHLGRSRLWLAALEIINWLWIVALIVSLAQGKGQQTRFLEGVELTLIVIIVLNGIGVNAVRMRRWALARALRLRSRDWSPLPTTSSTNAQLLNNAQLQGLGEAQEDAQAMTERMRGKDQPTLRWRMRETEGSFWMSYRPIIKCELVIPSVTYAHHAIARPPHSPVNLHDHPIEFSSPIHEVAHDPAPPVDAPAYSES